MQKKKVYLGQIKTMITELMMQKAPELKKAVCDEVNALPLRHRLALALKLLVRKFGL